MLYCIYGRWENSVGRQTLAGVTNCPPFRLVYWAPNGLPFGAILDNTYLHGENFTGESSLITNRALVSPRRLPYMLVNLNPLQRFDR